MSIYATLWALQFPRFGRNAWGSESTHCRSGRSGNTSSANSAAVSAILRPPPAIAGRIDERRRRKGVME
jgi:hypothetical protein